MKTVYVIGGGKEPSAIEEVKRYLGKDDINIICVESKEDIPLHARLSSDPSVIQEIHKFTARPIIEPVFYGKLDKKTHKRPYKFHR